VSWPSPGSTPSASLAETINATLRRQSDPPAPVTEDSLTFVCLRGDHRLRAADAEVRRSGTEVEYVCPVDGASLCCVGESSYAFSDGDLLIAAGEEEVSWWDYFHRGDE
jgi:hypothetical protein